MNTRLVNLQLRWNDEERVLDRRKLVDVKLVASVVCESRQLQKKLRGTATRPDAKRHQREKDMTLKLCSSARKTMEPFAE